MKHLLSYVKLSPKSWQMWAKFRFMLSVIMLIVLATSLGRAQNEQVIKSFELADLAAGQEGYALTAGAGNRLERFPVRVLALQEDVLSGYPLVLIQASGDFIAQVGGLAAGMSGSPVYLPWQGEDRLLGAIGYVFASSDHSLGMVTPIEVMKGERPLAAYKNLDYFGQEKLAGLGEAVAIATPLLMSGLSERSVARLEPLFQASPLKLMPTQSSSLGTFDETSYVLAPGSAISTQLVRGDVTIAAVGTLTMIEAERFWAFGHPLAQLGKVAYALAPAYVTYIVPSDIVPFKLANNGTTILGTIQEDNAYAISGVLGQQPAFIPVNLSINALGKRINKRFDVIDDERLYAALTSAAILQILDELFASRQGGTVAIAWDISLHDGEHVRILEQTADSQDIAFAASSLMADPLGILADNIFKAPQVDKVAISLDYRPEQAVAELVEVVADGEQELKKGDTLIAHLRLQHYRGEPEVVRLEIPLPEEAEDSLDITFRGGSESGPDEDENGLADKILSFTELLVALREQTQSSELVVETYLDGETVQLHRQTLDYIILGSEDLTVEIISDEDEDDDESEETCEVLEESQPTTPKRQLPEDEIFPEN